MEPHTISGKSLGMVLGGPGRAQALPCDMGGIATGLTMSTAPIENSLPQDAYLLPHGPVMTAEQLEILRRQISVYATICNQLVEMHKASMAQQTELPSVTPGQHLPYDPVFNSRSTGRQRWTPSQSQLQILEKLFEKGNGTPNKQKIKELTVELSRHGQISETNVYNWFQNRKARAKRKQQVVTQKDIESEVDTDEKESPKVKKATFHTGISEVIRGSGKLTVNGLALEEYFGMMDQKPHVSSHHIENQDNTLMTLLWPQVDTKFDIRSNTLLRGTDSYQLGYSEGNK